MKKQPLAGFSLGLALVAAAVILVLRRRSRVTESRVVYEAPPEEPRVERGGTMSEEQYQTWLAGIGVGWEAEGNWQDSSTLGPDPRDIGRGEWGGEEDDLAPFTLADLGLAPVDHSKDEGLKPFSLDELSTATDDLPADRQLNDDWLAPFSLADLGLSDEEIAAIEEIVAGPAAGQALGKEATMTAHDPKDGLHVDDCAPFSLLDLGLSVEEIYALGLEDSLPAEMRAAHEQQFARPAPTIAHVNDRVISFRRVPPVKPVTFRHIWWTPMWQQDVVIRHPRFYHWLKQWGADFGFAGPVGTLITQFSRYGWTTDDLIRYYLDELTVARKVEQPFSYGSTQWSDLPETIIQLQRLGRLLCHEGYRIEAIARQLLNAERAGLEARRVYVGLGQKPIDVPCTCALRRELERYGGLMWHAGYDDLNRAAKLTSELGIATPAMDELRKMGVIMPPPFDRPFDR